MKLTGAAILVSRGMKVLQAAPAAYPYRSAASAGQCKKCGKFYCPEHGGVYRTACQQDAAHGGTLSGCGVGRFAQRRSDYVIATR
jgi:hypothetical protein